MSEDKDTPAEAQIPEPPQAETPGFIRNLKGGFIAYGREFPACAVTGKPIFGAYASAFIATGGRIVNGKTNNVGGPAPKQFACQAGVIKTAVEMLGKAMVRGMGKSWDRKPIGVTFTWMYIPPPQEAISDLG